MTQDLIVSATLIVSFAVFVTAHCALAFRLVTALQPSWRVVWTLLPPTAWLAAYWGYRAGLRGNVVVWGVSLLVYAVALGMAHAAG